MTRGIGFLRRFGRRTRRDEGAASLEFVIAVPVVLMILLAGIEVGIVTLRQVMLERGLDITMRSLRLGHIRPVTLPALRRSICDNALIIPDCRADLLIELRRINTNTFNLPNAAATCVNRSVNTTPAVDLTPGVEHDLILVRACLLYDPVFPVAGWGLGLPVQADGTYRIVTASFYVNEPS